MKRARLQQDLRRSVHCWCSLEDGRRKFEGGFGGVGGLVRGRVRSELCGGVGGGYGVGLRIAFLGLEVWC